MKKAIILSVLFVIVPSWVLAYTPKAGTPLAKHEHPRLLITVETIPALRDVLAQHYKQEFQEYVNWAANPASGDLDNNILNEAGHDPIRSVMLHQAFVSALGQVSGISYPITMDAYAGKAITALINRLNAGDELSYVAALTYDWAYNYMTPAQRQEIANKMLTRRIVHKVFDHSLANPTIEPVRLFSSKYFECFWSWFLGLAFWGDGLIDAQADEAVDNFYNAMTNYGYLDAHNFVARNDGGWVEWISYASWHPRTHFLNVAAWRSATGEDYILQKATLDGNAIRNYPKYMRYAIDPHKYFNRHYSYVNLGSAETTDASFEHKSMREQAYILPNLLKQSGLLNEAGLVSDFIEMYEVEFPDYKHDYIYPFLGVHRSIQAVKAEQLNFPLSLWSQNVGVFFARTGFNSTADGVFSAMDGHFHFEAHDGPWDFPGFTLTKFGTLVNDRNVAHRGYGNLNDYPGGYQMNIVYFAGGHNASFQYMDDPAHLQRAANGQGNYDSGGIEQITRNNGKFYFVRVNRNRMFVAGVEHTREFVWLPGQTPDNDSDFLVVYDRTTAPTQPDWIYHVPWLPGVSGYSSSQDITTGSGATDRIGSGYNGSNIIIKELNSLGDVKDDDSGTQDYTGGGVAHGVMFSKTILPASARVEVSRVAAFDSDVIKRQHHLAIKSCRWQVAVKPEQVQNSHRFLHVFQTADANKISSMTASSLLQVGTVLQGVWIERERSDRPNYIVLFTKDTLIYENVVTYSVTGQGASVHIITGIKPYTIYEIKNIAPGGTTTQSKVTESDILLWDYKGVAENVTTGVLHFEANLTGSHTFQITRLGDQDLTPPGKPTGLKIQAK